ncbi:MAG: hybrid sensor histidine kinase/response regulator [Flavisolibacter sp.]
MKPVRILMLEDNPLDAAVIQKTLSRIPFQTSFTLTTTASEYIEKLHQQDYDLILSDYQLPHFDAVKALKARNEKNSSIPFILITGAVSEEVAILILKQGADDYILKDRLQRLPFAVEKLLAKQQIKHDKQFLETSLSELTQRFQLAANSSFDVIWDYNLEKNRVYCSSAIEKIIGRSTNENFHPDDLKRFIHPDDLPAVAKSFVVAVTGKENRWRKIFRVIRNDGAVAWVNINTLILRDMKDQAIRVTGVLHDVTEVRRLQHQLVALETQAQRQMAAITIEAQEKERMEIGRELHDNVNQILATAKIMIDTAKNFPDLRELCLLKSQEAIMEAIKELRALAHSMMPPPFENNEFENVLRDLVHNINFTGKINLELSLPPAEEVQKIPNNIKLCLYRIIQEQVSNILKYAKAKNASVWIKAGDMGYSLSIEDDGVGFDPGNKSKGIGLKNMESRCHLFNGTMELITAPGKGCRIKVTLPVPGEADSSVGGYAEKAIGGSFI